MADSFTYFNRLAPELRLKILHTALSLFPRIFHIHPADTGERDYHNVCGGGIMIKTSSTMPLLAINREYRTELLKSFATPFAAPGPPVFSPNQQSPFVDKHRYAENLQVNYSFDIIFIDVNACIFGQVRYAGPEVIFEDLLPKVFGRRGTKDLLANTERLALGSSVITRADNDLSTKKIQYQALKKAFSGLKEVMFVVEEVNKHHSLTGFEDAPNSNGRTSALKMGWAEKKLDRGVIITSCKPVATYFWHKKLTATVRRGSAEAAATKATLQVIAGDDQGIKQTAAAGYKEVQEEMGVEHVLEAFNTLDTELST